MTKPDVTFIVKLYKDDTKNNIIKISYQPGHESEVIGLLISLYSKELYHAALHELDQMVKTSPELEKSVQSIFAVLLSQLNSRKEQPAILASQTFKRMG